MRFYSGLQRIARDPPEDFAEDLPFGGVTDVERRIFVVRGDKQVGAGDALEAGDFESEITVGDNRDFLVEVIAIGSCGVDEDDGTGKDNWRHRVASEAHADHVLRVWAPGERSEEDVFDLGF